MKHLPILQVAVVALGFLTVLTAVEAVLAEEWTPKGRYRRQNSPFLGQHFLQVPGNSFLAMKAFLEQKRVVRQPLSGIGSLSGSETLMNTGSDPLGDAAQRGNFAVVRTVSQSQLSPRKQGISQPHSRETALPQFSRGQTPNSQHHSSQQLPSEQVVGQGNTPSSFLSQYEQQRTHLEQRLHVPPSELTNQPSSGMGTQSFQQQQDVPLTHGSQKIFHQQVNQQGHQPRKTQQMSHPGTRQQVSQEIPQSTQQVFPEISHLGHQKQTLSQQQSTQQKHGRGEHSPASPVTMQTRRLTPLMSTHLSHQQRMKESQGISPHRPQHHSQNVQVPFAPPSASDQLASLPQLRENDPKRTFPSTVQRQTSKQGEKTNDRIRAPGCGEAPDPGVCRAAFPRFYYNASLDQCDCFLYGGCSEDEQRAAFNSLESCHHFCIPGDTREGERCREIFKGPDDDDIFPPFGVQEEGGTLSEVPQHHTVLSPLQGIQQEPGDKKLTALSNEEFLSLLFRDVIRHDSAREGISLE